MVHSGRLRERCTFERQTSVSDGQGGFSTSWAAIMTIWGRLEPTRGNELLEAGRLESSNRGVLRVRSSPETEAITVEDRVLIEGDEYQIRNIINPDRRDRVLEFVVERGVAQ